MRRGHVANGHWRPHRRIAALYPIFDVVAAPRCPRPAGAVLIICCRSPSPAAVASPVG